MEVYEIFQLLESTNSRNKKIDILKKNKDDKNLQRVLKFALDGNLVLGLKKIPDYMESVQGLVPIFSTLNQIEFLFNSTIRGNSLIETVSQILENSIPQERETIKRIIRKDLKCGVSKTTVNKVFGKGFVMDYPCMLANSYNEKNMKNIEFPCLAQIKSDGMRINLYKQSDVSLIAKTRNGKLVDHRNLWTHLFAHVPVNMVLDGEAVVVKDNIIQSRKIGNGVLNKIIKGTATDDEINSVYFVFWDAITMGAFIEGEGKLPYSSRVELVGKMFDPSIFNTFGRAMSARTWRIQNIEEAHALFNKVVEDGDEGLILKNEDSHWEDKRSKNLVKMKVENDCDLVITGWVEGEGKYEGMMGALTCESSDGKLVVNVGSGFTDNDRRTITEDVIGKIMTVKYNEVISDKKKKTKSLFLPIYQEIREDKTEANKMIEIK